MSPMLTRRQMLKLIVAAATTAALAPTLHARASYPSELLPPGADFDPRHQLEPWVWMGRPIHTVAFYEKPSASAKRLDVRYRDQAVELLGRTRLLTLTGPGGTGKTRLALQAAAERLEAYPGGTWFVALEQVTDPALAPAEILAALGVQAGASQPPLERLIEHLREREARLVAVDLDNDLAILRLVGDDGKAERAEDHRQTARAARDAPVALARVHRRSGGRGRWRHMLKGVDFVFFSSRRRHTRSSTVSWARRCV